MSKMIEKNENTDNYNTKRLQSESFRDYVLRVALRMKAILEE